MTCEEFRRGLIEQSERDQQTASELLADLRHIDACEACRKYCYEKLGEVVATRPESMPGIIRRALDDSGRLAEHLATDPEAAP